jgi:light-regulated signal transduction histidine kinase (bacteriophytochrome)
MSGLIKDLLEYSRVSAKDKHPTPLALSGVLDYAKANLRAVIEETDALITSDPLPAVTADIGEMRHLFQNLIGNALKFRMEGRRPEIHIGARREAGEWVVHIKDNGIGMPQKQHDRIFVIFQRLHRRGKYPGTGIGLAICKKIVERHGGRIWVESEPGTGSTFLFSLPAEESPPQARG